MRWGRFVEGERGERTWTRTSLSPENDYRCSNPCRPNGRTAGAPGRVDVTSGIDGIMRRFPTDTTDLRRTRMAGDTDGQCPLCTDLTWSDGAGHEMEGTAQEEVIRLLYRVGGGAWIDAGKEPYCLFPWNTRFSRWTN